MSPEKKNPKFDLPPEILALPIVCQEEVRAVLALNREIELRAFEDAKLVSRELWAIGIITIEDRKRMRPEEEASSKRFKRKHFTLGEIRKVIPPIRENVQGIFEGYRPYATKAGSWEAGMKFYDLKIENALDLTDRTYAVVAAVQMVEDQARRIIEEGLSSGELHSVYKIDLAMVGLDVEFNALVMTPAVLKDKLLGVNPFYHVLALYRLGVTTEFLLYNRDQERFMVHFPLSLNGEIVSACLSVGDNESGEIKTIRVHELDLNCLKSPGKLREVELPSV